MEIGVVLEVLVNPEIVSTEHVRNMTNVIENVVLMHKQDGYLKIFSKRAHGIVIKS